jgi:phage tail sheath protein FI
VSPIPNPTTRAYVITPRGGVQATYVAWSDADCGYWCSLSAGAPNLTILPAPFVFRSEDDALETQLMTHGISDAYKKFIREWGSRVLAAP